MRAQSEIEPTIVALEFIVGPPRRNYTGYAFRAGAMAITRPVVLTAAGARMANHSHV